MLGIATTTSSADSGRVVLSDGGDATMDHSLLRLRGVAQTFGSGAAHFHALDDINLEVPPGEFLCLLGPSGCGKSTLLNIIAGFVRASSGSVKFGDQEVSHPGPSRMMLFQDSSLALFPWLSAKDNVEFGLKMRSVPTTERRMAVTQYLAMVGLGTHSHKFPHEMSGGMRQRLQIARALATKPEMLLMDEPFGALDALTRRHMHRVLLDVWEKTGKTVIFVTHDIAESLLLADRIAIMSVGPRSRICDLLDLRHLARPRDPATTEFGAAYREIERLLDSDPNRQDLL